MCISSPARQTSAAGYGTVWERICRVPLQHSHDTVVVCRRTHLQTRRAVKTWSTSPLTPSKLYTILYNCTLYSVILSHRGVLQSVTLSYRVRCRVLLYTTEVCYRVLLYHTPRIPVVLLRSCSVASISPAVFLHDREAKSKKFSQRTTGTICRY
jgi:hypothetical protein